MSVKDANNLRQLGVAFNLYTSEHDGKYPEFVYPPNSGWDMCLIPYLYPEIDAGFLENASALQGYKGSLEVFHHPMDKVPRSHPRSYAINPCIYCFNGVYNIFGQAPHTACRVLNVSPPVASPSKFALLFPAVPPAGVVGASVGDYNGFTIGGPSPVNVFSNGGNYLFADGHIEMVKLKPDYSNWYPYLWGTP